MLTSYPYPSVTVYIEVIPKQSFCNSKRTTWIRRHEGALILFRQRYQAGLHISAFLTHPDCHLQVPITEASNQRSDATRPSGHTTPNYARHGLGAGCILLQFNP